MSRLPSIGLTRVAERSDTRITVIDGNIDRIDIASDKTSAMKTYLIKDTRLRALMKGSAGMFSCCVLADCPSASNATLGSKPAARAWNGSPQLARILRSKYIIKLPTCGPSL
ncbi:MAG: hypothetical protein ACXV29_09025 [Halobacteriota archaeon]